VDAGARYGTGARPSSGTGSVPLTATLAQLRVAVETIADDIPPRELVAAFDRIAGAYEAAVRRTDVTTAVDAVAYACARAPGTYTAVERVLRAITSVQPHWRPRSVLDVGAGIGSAAWAAVAQFDSIADVTLLERSEEMIALGRQVSAAGGEPLVDATWLVGDASQPPEGTWDVVVASYVLGEIPDAERRDVTEQWFAATSGELVVVEPGSKDGFEVVRRAREHLITLGATISAPCPHDGTCPMAGGDWCHFAVRVARTKLQRQIKAGDRGYEDEKYSYVVASRQGPVARSPRVVGPPRRRGGHVRLKLCTTDGLNELIVAKREAERYRSARKLEWGDAFEQNPER
jgi:ribosomal protein RSM22 (predicted rRNA methylase)